MDADIRWRYTDEFVIARFINRNCGRIVRLGYRFWLLAIPLGVLIEVDIDFNIRYPRFGESDGGCTRSVVAISGCVPLAIAVDIQEFPAAAEP